jgi:hypothetical protein
LIHASASASFFKPENRIHFTAAPHNANRMTLPDGILSYNELIFRLEVRQLSLLQHFHDIGHFPKLLGNAGRHCRRDAKRLMDADEIVIHRMKCNRGRVVHRRQMFDATGWRGRAVQLSRVGDL